jgi:hypothetical protein
MSIRSAARPALVLVGVASLSLVLWTNGAAAATANPAAAPQRSPSVQAQQGEQIRALIVRYERGYAPRGRVLGITSVTGAQRSNLTLGSALGGRMWRIDFKTPVDEATARRVARQLARHPAVDFAELDRKVTAFSGSAGAV